MQSVDVFSQEDMALNEFPIRIVPSLLWQPIASEYIVASAFSPLAVVDRYKQPASAQDLAS